LRVFNSIILLLFLIPALNPAAERRLEFRDGTPEWHRYVKKTVNELSENNLADKLTQNLVNQGFLNNSIVEVPGDSSKRIIITFGEQFYFGNLIFEGDKIDTIFYNQQFIRFEYESMIDSLLKNYQNMGYYFANLSAQKYLLTNNRLDLLMNLQIGPTVTVSSVEFMDAVKTDITLLKQYVTFKTGDKLDDSKIEISAKNLDKLDFVSIKEPPEIIPDAGYQTARVKFLLSEGRQFDIEGAGGYVPDDNGYFIGYLKSKIWNYFGGGRSLGILIDRREKNNSTFELSYGQPLFILGRGRGEVRLATRDYRDLFYEFGIDGFYRFGLGNNFQAQINLGWKNTEPDDNLLQGYDAYEIGFGVEMGEIVEKRNIGSQLAVGWNIRYVARRYGSSGSQTGSISNINDTRNELKAEFALNPFNSLSTYFKFDLRDIASSERPLPIAEQFLFGGVSDLRGYRNDQFSARRLIISTIEPRYFLSISDFLYPFIDAAFYENYELNVSGDLYKADDFVWGYGIGFNLSTDDRRLKFEFSWGEDSPIDQPRLNVVLFNNF